MLISFKRETRRAKRGIAKRISVLLVTTTLVLVLIFLFLGQVTDALPRLPFTLPNLTRLAAVATNGANQWINSGNKISVPLSNFSPPRAKQSAWTQGDTALLDAPSVGRQIAHVGAHFPLTLLGGTTRVGGILWYHVQWSVPKIDRNGWVSASALTFNWPGKVASNASFDALSPDLWSYLTNLGSNTGAVAYDLTRQRIYTYNSSTPFISASSMKVPIMLTFLDSVELQGREPTGDEMNFLTMMIENSDNDSASTLYSAVGGAEGIVTYMQKIGVNDLIPDDDAWGYSTVTPQSMVNLLTLLYSGKILNTSHRALALNLMENVEPDQQTGVGETAPPEAIVALKDGWVIGDDNLWAVNSSGIVTVGNETYIISVFTQAQQALEDGQDIARKVCRSVASLLL
jgi:beta-lactamase class A